MFTKEKRSDIMARIKSKGTKIEIKIKNALSASGISFVYCCTLGKLFLFVQFRRWERLFCRSVGNWRLFVTCRFTFAKYAKEKWGFESESSSLSWVQIPQSKKELDQTELIFKEIYCRGKLRITPHILGRCFFLQFFFISASNPFFLYFLSGSLF